MATRKAIKPDPVIEKRLVACKALNYEPKGKDALIFGKSTAAKVMGVSVTVLEENVEPCGFTTNPHYKSGPQVALYDPVHVLEALRDERVKSASADIAAKRPAREAAARKAVATKEAQVLAELEGIIESTDWTKAWPKCLADARVAAIQSYNSFERRKDGQWASQDSSEEFLERITVNFLRHECTSYEWLLESFKGRVGVQQIHDLLQAHINELVFSHYHKT